MVTLSDLTFLARGIAGGIKNVAGSTVTVALATLAEGLSKSGNIDINAISASLARTVTVRNSGGSGIDLIVEGFITAFDDISAQNNLIFKENGANKFTLTGTPTGVRTVTFPDSTGTVALKGINNAFSTTQSVTGAVNASSTVSVQNNGSTQSITFTGNPTGNRVVTFPDADVTIGAGSGYLGSYTQTALNAIVPSGFAWAFCNNIAGSGGGTTGVPAYWTPVTGVWLRFATDTTI